LLGANKYKIILIMKREVEFTAKLIKKGWAFKSFICDVITILKLLMNIIEIVVNYYDLYDDLPTNIVVMPQFAHSSNQGN
jgi:hypothetical protein